MNLYDVVRTQVTASGQSVSGKAGGSFYWPELDALRFAAFALVFCAHDLPSMDGYVAAGLPFWIWGPLDGLKSGGRYGVDLFFLLSAYLITEILLREYRQKGVINIRAFIMRRILRIWPLYFAFIAVAYWLIPLFYDQNFPAWVALAYATLWGNFAVILAPANLNTVAGILWSVSIEEQFYLLWPFVLRKMLRYLREICIGLLVFTSLVRICLVLGFDANHLSLWYNTLARLDPIAAGALLAFVLDGRTLSTRTTIRVASIIVGLVIIVMSGMFLNDGWKITLLGYPLATVAALLMLTGVLGVQWRIPGMLIYLGRISYGLYVFHILAITITREHIHISSPYLEWTAQFSAAFLLTVVLATISYRWYEKPFLRLKSRFSQI